MPYIEYMAGISSGRYLAGFASREELQILKQLVKGQLLLKDTGMRMIIEAF
jgi:hypothetical protein